MGTLFGVYEFIEEYLGVRWLWPGALGTYIPQTDTLEVWSLNETEAPALTFRSFYWGNMQGLSEGRGSLSEADARLGFSPEGAKRYAEALRVLLRRHRMGGLDAKPRAGHTFYGWWAKYGKEHPDWFAMRRDGTRVHPNPEDPNVSVCITNEELQNFVLEQWDGESVLSLGPTDRPGRCMCAKCQAWDAPQPDPIPWFASMVYATDPRSKDYFAGATSDRYARFWKLMLDKASERNPDARVSVSFIYENEFPAPVSGIKLDNRIYGEFVQWQDPHLRWFPMPDEAFDWIKAQWLGWRETGIRMAYRPNYLHDGYVMPHFETRQSGEFFKFAYAHGMEGASFDSLTGQWAMQGLRLYMHMRLMAKPDLELDAVREEYFSAFGPAAETMKKYYTYWEDYAFKNTLPFVELYSDVGRRYANYVRHAHEAFPEKCFKPAEKLIARALRETQEDPRPEFSERVRFIQLGLEHAQLATQLTAIYAGEEVMPEERREEGRAALQKLVQFRKAHEDSFFSDLLHVTSYWERSHLDVDDLIAASPEG